MCGRLSQTTAAEKVTKMMRILGTFPDLGARYNIAPSLPLASIRRTADNENEWAVLVWGLIPSWAKERKTGFSMFNARAETVAEKPAYRAAFRARRCLIPADHFFEWKEVTGQKRKQAFEISYKSGEPMLFAGLWERWQHENDVVESCTIITTEANTLMSTIHDRMPVIIPVDKVEQWLDTSQKSTADLQRMLAPYGDEEDLTMRPIEFEKQTRR